MSATTIDRVDPQCECIRCVSARTPPLDPGLDDMPITVVRMFICQICGNKRCPHSDDHRNACTGSNEPGQPGSRYQRATLIGGKDR